MNYIPTDDGKWVSEHFERLARVVQDYDPQFALYYIPPEQRTDPEDQSKAYCVMDEVTHTPVLYAGALDTPESILGRLFDSDNKQGNVLERIDAHNNAIRALQMKEQMDRDEERQEKIAWLIGTPKNFINMGNGRVVDDQLRLVRRGRG
jgi:hypothetical protein